MTCPTPWKIGYATAGEAKRVVKRARQQNALSGQMRTYRCSCGRHHLTSMSKSARRIWRRRHPAAA